MQERIDNAIDALDSSDFSEDDGKANPDKQAAKNGPIRPPQPPIQRSSGQNPRKSYPEGKDMSKEDEESQRTVKRETTGGLASEKHNSALIQSSKSYGTQPKLPSTQQLEGRALKAYGNGGRQDATIEAHKPRLSRQQFEEDLEQPRNLYTVEQYDGRVLKTKAAPSLEHLKPKIAIPNKHPTALNSTGRSLGGLSHGGSDARLLGRPDFSNTRNSLEPEFQENNYSGGLQSENPARPMDRSRQNHQQTLIRHSQEFAGGSTGYQSQEYLRHDSRNWENNQISKQNTQKLVKKSLKPHPSDEHEQEKDEPGPDLQGNRYRTTFGNAARDYQEGQLAQDHIKLTVKSPPQLRQFRERMSDDESTQRVSGLRRKQAVSRTTRLDDDLDPEAADFRDNEGSANHPTAKNPTGNGSPDEAEEDFQLFTEHDTGYSFCTFMMSREVHWTKKVTTLIFFSLYMICSVLSVLDLVKYSESDCSLAVTTSVVYYLLCFVGVFLKFSGYVFIQMELLGRIDYTAKVDDCFD